MERFFGKEFIVDELILNEYTLNYKGKQNKNVHRKNEITFNTSSSKIYDSRESRYLINFYENELVKIKYSDGREKTCIVSFKKYSNISFDMIFSKNLRRGAGEEVGFFKIESYPHLLFERCTIANLENVKKSKIEIFTQNMLCNGKRIININDERIMGFNIINNLNGSSIYVEKKDLIYHQSNQSSSVIRLNHEHRMMLDLELPNFINQYYLDIIDKQQPENSEFKEYYPCENQNICYQEKDSTFEIQKKIKTTLENVNKGNNKIYQLSVYPVYGTNFSRDSIYNKIIYYCLGKLLRNKIKMKKVIRPYSIDETDNVVRLTSNSIKQIGVDENDSIIIRNNLSNKFIRAKVLLVDDEYAIFQENRIKSNQYLNLCIGIPLHLRNILKLESIDASVSIERDLIFLFKKRLNNQVQSILGLVLSVIALKGYIQSEITLILISILISILLTFLSFSDIREKIEKVKEE